ncbi:hypothetical protein [Vibrio mediterranei]|uniref:hypothetical protein n=1 Tax=Vibrio mediterranei TaxID=689 RepID=UPI00148DD0B3|nr:hypothetical protein [Vibrio mediterranei]NOI26331.1 hypothetical protein [Vibrio mediterranei]
MLNKKAKRGLAIGLSIAILATVKAFAGGIPDDASPARRLGLISYHTPNVSQNTIYSNGSMQSPILVKYELKPGFINPVITLKEKFTQNTFPIGHWQVSSTKNNYANFINTSSPSSHLAAISTRSLSSQETRTFYITNSSKSNESINICAELTATQTSTGNQITQSTCDFAPSNEDSVTVSTRSPMIFDRTDFTLQRHDSVKDEDAGYWGEVEARYYELTANDKNNVFSVANLDELDIRRPNGSGQLWASPNDRPIVVTTSDKAYSLEFLTDNTSRYESNDRNGETSFTLNTRSRAEHPILKIAAIWGHNLKVRTAQSYKEVCNGGGWLTQSCHQVAVNGYTKYTWPVDGNSRSKRSKNIILRDGYGNEYSFTFTIDGSWNWYFQNLKIW